MLSPDATAASRPTTRLPRLRGWFSPYRLFLRPLLFLCDAESVHHLVTGVARLFWALPFGRRLTRAVYARRLEAQPVRLAGLELGNPLGLAAGFDKNAQLVPGIESLGFGFVEVGTVTPRPQLGNPRPRLSRIPEKRAILNRMGFNNDGAEVIAEQLRRIRDQVSVPVGVNLGKNRDTPNSQAFEDYEILFKAFRHLASYFTVNISSPNTPGLRELQSTEFLVTLGARLVHHRLNQPVFVKLAPDVAAEDLVAIGALCGTGKPYAGLILTNTIATDLGGLSGYPLKGPSTALLKLARSRLPEELPIISVGGIETADDVIERLKLGANAVQLYSGLIYGGPGVVGRILRDLQRKVRKLGIRSLGELRSR